MLNVCQVVCNNKLIIIHKIYFQISHTLYVRIIIIFMLVIEKYNKYCENYCLRYNAQYI